MLKVNLPMLISHSIITLADSDDISNFYDIAPEYVIRDTDGGYIDSITLDHEDDIITLIRNDGRDMWGHEYKLGTDFEINIAKNITHWTFNC